MGLLEALKQYASDAAGGSLNPEVGNTLSGLLNYGKDRAKYIGGLLDDSSPINKDFKNWHDRTQLGLADLIAGKEGPQADYGYSQIMNMAGVAPLGITAWHGSPHKFDKFSLDKIGTGEGAQAYGHGLYTAEAQDVGKEYARKLANVDSSGYANAQLNAQNLVQKFKGDKEWAKEVVRDQLANLEKADPNFQRLSDTLLVLEGKSPQQLGSEGYLYKVDIPDEAVARFLDWDKKLSEQAPEVQRAIKNSPIGNRPDIDNLSGNSLHDLLMFDAQDKVAAKTGKARNGSQQNAVSAYLQSQGIPGIRYLDGGSRSAGQGSSNFVVFDPEMIRILERNGQATGLEPWKPGEYRLGDLLK